MSVLALQKSIPEVRTEIPGLAAKGTQAPELQKALTLEVIQSRYHKGTWTHFFTDVSAENAVRNGGSGAYIRRPDGTTSSLSIPAGDLSSNYRAKVHALKAATELLIEEDCNQQNIRGASRAWDVLNPAKKNHLTHFLKLSAPSFPQKKQNAALSPYRCALNFFLTAKRSHNGLDATQ